MTSGTQRNWENPYLLDEDAVDTAVLASPLPPPQYHSNYNATREPSHTWDTSTARPQRQDGDRRASLAEVSPINSPTIDPYFRPQNIQPPVTRAQDRGWRSNNPTASVESSRVVIAIDYGTTYTGVAVALTKSGYANLEDIEVLQDWGPNGNNEAKVRTMISYVKSSTGQTQWGSAVSNHATAMVNTKLELQRQANRFDELELTYYLLTGTGNLAFEHLRKIGPDPAYPSAPPKQIVQDYLSHIRESACRRGALKKVDLSKLVETKTPLDIVVTVPAKWSFQATDATFKAIRGAGFNRTTFPTLRDTILVSEPEAASFFAIRDHQASDGVDLRVGDCFILCDAGGGTVDVVSYQVTKVKPQLEIERATEPDSRKCGSAFIDTEFKKWLRHELGVENYAKLDPLNAQRRITAHTLESGPIRKLVQDFIVRKQTFSQTSPDIALDLPAPLDAMNRDPRVREGQLTISNQEMRELFDECIYGVIELMDSQMQKLAKAKNRRARNVFLVGGFGASPYLQHLLDESLGLRRNTILRRPNADKSLTAVVRGAVIYGVEKGRHENVKYMSAAKDNFAICLDYTFHWFARKGDLILSTQRRSSVSKGFFLKLKSCPMRKFEVPIYKYCSRNDGDDFIPDKWEDGQHEVEVIGAVQCDVSTLLDRELRIPKSQQKQDNFEIGPFTWAPYLQVVKFLLKQMQNARPYGMDGTRL